jgi:hypothetical protein
MYGSETLPTTYVQLIQWNGAPVSTVSSSDPDPDPLVRDTDPSISQRYGYGSFYHQAKVVRKTLTPSLLFFCMTSL